MLLLSQLSLPWLRLHSLVSTGVSREISLRDLVLFSGRSHLGGYLEKYRERRKQTVEMSSPSLSSYHKSNNNRKLSISLSPREIKRFVACYRKHELLWNTKCPQYTIPVARNEALRAIAEEMGKTWSGKLKEK